MCQNDIFYERADENALKFNKCSALFSIFDGLKTSMENFGPT